MRWFVVLACGAGISGMVCLECRSGDPVKNARDTARGVAIGTVRGMTMPALVAEQHQKALANWKRLFAAETPASSESTSFLLYGTISGRVLKDVGPVLDKHAALARKALDMESEEPWPGKMAVYFFTERTHYNSFVRVVDKRKAEDDEASSFDIEGDEPHVTVRPSDSKVDLGVVAQAGEQAAGALLTKKTSGASVPSWIISGFGRATAFRAGALKDLSAEHRRAQVLALQKKKGLRDAVGSGLPTDEATVLRASVVEYLAYSGKTAKFLPMLKGFRPTEDMPEPTFEAALMSVNLSGDLLEKVWQAWLKTVK